MTTMRADRRAARLQARLTGERVETVVTEIADWLLLTTFSAIGFLVFILAIWG